MKRASACVAFGLGMSLALSGCGSTESKPTHPDGTLEQTLHNINGKDLGKLAVGQTISFTVRNGENVRVYNLTTNPIDEAAFKRTVSYFAALGDDLTASYPATIYPQGQDKPENVISLPTPRTVVEHDFVLVPPKAMPHAIGGGTNAITIYFPEQLQDISVIAQPSGGTGQPDAFENGPGLFVEACQSMVDVLPVGGSNANPLDQATEKRLTQETFFNSLGYAAAKAKAGAPYGDYTNSVAKDTGGSISFNSTVYRVDYSTLQPNQYSALQHAVAGN